MITLREKVHSGLSLAEICDILWSLVNRVEQDLPIGSDPDEILLDEDNRVEVRHLGEGVNLAMAAPEVVRAFLESKPLPDIGGDQAWFTLGMLAYFAVMGKEYYLETGLRVMELPDWIGRRSSVISSSHVSRIAFGQAICQMTAVEPELRRQGIVSFVRYLTENQPAVAQIIYTCGGQTVGSERRTLQDDIVDLIPTGTVTLSGVVYRPLKRPVRITYRPGTHSFSVELERMQSAAPETARYLAVEQSVLTGAKSGPENWVEVMSLGREDDSRNLTVTGVLSVEFRLCALEDGIMWPQRTIRQQLPATAVKNNVVIAIKYLAKENALSIRVLNQLGGPLTPTRRVELG